MTNDAASSSPSPDAGLREILPYLLPMIVFLTLTNLEAYLPAPSWYPLAYSAKVVIVALLLWHYRANWRDLKPAPGLTIIGLAIAHRPDRLRALGEARGLVS